MASDNSSASYVRLENANLIKLTIRKLSRLYTDYAKILIELKEMKANKGELSKKIIENIKRIQEQHSLLKRYLPEELPPEAYKTKLKRFEVKPEVKDYDVELEEVGIESFEDLKKEFEIIRKELESLKRD